MEISKSLQNTSMIQSRHILQQYIDIAIINIDINIGFHLAAISISVLKYWWQYIAHFMVDEKIF